MEGGFQVNAQGRRFANEALGYSEAPPRCCASPAHRVRHLRHTDRGRGAPVRGFPQCREGARS
jgi:hypothetical protein